MLFAAGFGTRMGPLTEGRPKPMIPVAGRPLVDHAVALAREAGITRIVANTHYLPHLIEPHLEALGVAISREEPEILDTGGGLLHALPHLGAGPVFTLNTDAVWTGPNPLAALAAAWSDGMDALLMCVPGPCAHGRAGPGDFALEKGRLTRGGDLVYTGAQIIHPRALNAEYGRVFSLSRVWTDLAERGALHGMVHEGHWADVGHPGGIAAAEAMLHDV